MEDPEREEQPTYNRRGSVFTNFTKLTKASSFAPSSSPSSAPSNSWWFASTAIPLLAATTGPLSNVLSIAALVTPWRVSLPDNGQLPLGTDDNGVGIADPHWEITLNALSLACGFTGNFFLLLNFTGRVRYLVALPLSIVFWVLASSILIALAAAMHIHDAPIGPGEIYSQGFWHAVLAAILYFLGSLMLVVNMIGHFLGRYPDKFELDADQRTLILQTMMFFFWLAGAAGIFTRLEGWSYANALYFTDVSVLTVGFGDIAPLTSAGRGFLFVFELIGIIFLGLVISSITRFVRDISAANIVKPHQRSSYKSTLGRTVTNEKELRDRLGLPPWLMPASVAATAAANDAERRSRRTSAPVRAVDSRPPRAPAKVAAAGHTPSISANLRAANPVLDKLVPPGLARQRSHATSIHAATGIAGTASQPRSRHGSAQVYGHLEIVGHNVTYHEPTAVVVTGGRGGAARRVPIDRRRDGDLNRNRRDSGEVKALRGRQQQRQKKKLLLLREEKDRFDAMREIQEETRRFKQYYALAMALLAFGVLWGMGALVFMFAERRLQGLTYFEALYFCLVALLTIGFGDIAPKSNAGKPFFIVWSLLAVPTMTILIQEMSQTVATAVNRGTFAVADWTVLPKKGVAREFLDNHPQLRGWLQRLADEHQARLRRRQRLLPSRKLVVRGIAETDSKVAVAAPTNGKAAESLTDRKAAAPTTASRATAAQTEAEARTVDGEKPPAASPPPEAGPPAAEAAPAETRPHHLARQLAVAIRDVAHDLRADPPARYSYEQWSHFARLIRFSQRRGRVEGGEEADENEATEEEEEGLVEWDWIGEDSPMLADVTEAQWVLDRLCESLNRYTRQQARRQGEEASRRPGPDEGTSGPSSLLKPTRAPFDRPEAA